MALIFQRWSGWAAAVTVPFTKGDSHVWGQVARKALRPKDAARELAAHAALPPHDSITPIFDVSWSRGGLALLALPMCDSSLSTWAGARGATPQDEEVRHVAVVVLGALAHMHPSGVLHSGVNPAHILVNGPGLCDIRRDAARVA